VPEVPKVEAALRAISLLTIIIVVCACGGREEKSFYRVEPEHFQRDASAFKVDKTMGRISFQKGKDNLQLDEIPSPDGCYFYLKEKKQLVITPPLTGDIGFYSYLYFRSLVEGRPINFIFEIHTDGKTRKIDQIVNEKQSEPFFKDLTLTPGDRLLLRFEGRGVVYFSTPVIYRKKTGKGRRNIIFIALDTLRGDQIGARVHGLSLTPNIDRFIKDSVYFKNACAQTSWTLPSFMSLFTGLYEYNHDVGVKNPLDPDKPFLVAPLSKEFITFGYHGGKVMDSRWGYWRGFDFYKHFRFAGSLFPRGGQSLFQKAGELLERSNFPDLFLFLHTYQVHAPYTPPPEFLHKLNREPKFEKLDAVNDNAPARTYFPVDENVKESLKELYRAEILAFDAYFGQFIDRLKAMDLYRNSMIVFMSDHGEEFFEHKGWTHSHALYREQIGVPVIVKFPGDRFKGREITDVVGVIDIFPTILSFYGIRNPAVNIDGRDLMPLVESKGKRNPEFLISTISTGRYFDAVPPKIAVRFDHYKLIYNQPFGPGDLEFFKDYAPPPETPTFELFDLNVDPGETRNIIDSHPELEKMMMPEIVKIDHLIKQKLAEAKKANKPLDKEAEAQLKSLGYL